MSFGDAILPPSIPSPWFDETRPPPETAAHAPAKRRSDLSFPDTVPPLSKRWRSRTLHPETLVPTTASPIKASPSTAQQGWRAGVLRALRPCRRVRGKQADPSEVIVKRPRLDPAQVMPTTLVE